MKWKWTIPNVLSLYRLLMFPVLLVMIFQEAENWFALFFCINLFTDVLDGFIARRFNQQSEIGIMLDSWADFGSYLLAIIGMVHFHPEVHERYPVWLGAFLFLYFLQLGISKWRHGVWIAGWHAYSTKVAGYTQAFFFAALFVYGLVDWLFITAIILGVLTELELIALNFVCDRPVKNVKGIYWYLKQKGN